MTEQPAVPSSSERTPELRRRRFVCPHCDAFSQQDWHPLGRSSNSSNVFVVLEPRDAFHQDEDPAWLAARCGGCDQWSLWRAGTMVHPPARLGAAAHPDMPADVRELYSEAGRVAAVSRRAGAALARAAVERLIKLLDPDAPTNATLNRRIDRIRPRVSAAVEQSLEVVRFVGNKMLHAEPPEQTGELIVMVLDDDEGPQMVEWLLAAVNDLVDELITKPRLAAAHADRLPDGIRSRLRPPGVNRP